MLLVAASLLLSVAPAAPAPAQVTRPAHRLAPAAAPADDLERAVSVVPVSEPTAADEGGGFSYFFPMGLDDDLHPAVDDNLVILWLAYGIGGFLWPGYILTDELAGVDYLYEAAFSSFLHNLILFIPLPCLIVPIVGYVFFLVWALVFNWYLMPVAYINLYSRALKRAEGGGGSGGGDGGKKRKKREAPPERLESRRGPAPAPGFASAGADGALAY